MDATPRFRLFENRRGNGDPEEGAPQTLPRRRMPTSVSVARARRRNRRRPGAHRGLALVPRLLSLSGVTSTSSRRRAVLLLLLAVCGAVAFFTAKLLSWASRSPRRPPPHASADPVANIGDDVERRRNQHRPRPGVSLGPDAIPSVVLVERGPGGARKASSLDADAAGGAPTAGGGGEMEEENHDHHPRRCLNTVQGTTLLADSEGRVCHRTELDDDAHRRPGCCAARPPPPFPTREEEEDGVRDGNALARKGSYSGRGELMMPPVLSGGAATSTAAVRQSGGGGDGFPPALALSTPFSCWSCDEGGDGGAGNGSYSSCCLSYEFCVACCQAPWREKEREAIRAAAAHSGHPAYRELGFSNNDNNSDLGSRKKLTMHQLRGTDEGEASSAEGGEEVREVRKAQEAAFAHCAFRCRTYSGSVAHENSYRSPLKHCFGRFRPPVVVAVPGMPAVGVEGGAMLGGGREVVENDRGEGAPPLQLDPFLTGLMDA